MFKKIDLKLFLALATLSTAAIASDGIELRFEQDWQKPHHTRIALEDTDVNKILQEHYTTSHPVHITRSMLWEIERLKAWDPKTYIHHVVNQGTSWGRRAQVNGDEVFTRTSQQRQWMTGEHAQVIEEVYLNNAAQKVTFVGVASALDEHGQLIQTQNSQPLFHVEHGVSGTEDRPLNTWRIVHLTDSIDQSLITRFETFRDPSFLPEFVKVYIENNLKTIVTRKIN